MNTVAVVGATGFVGSAVRKYLEAASVAVRPVEAPRVGASGSTRQAIVAQLANYRALLDQLSRQFTGAQCVINTAGIARPDGANWEEMCGANALLPFILAAACAKAGVNRYVHVSSAAVQGRTTCLDESDALAPFSPYSQSKALGEEVVLKEHHGTSVIVFRPTSVHGLGRRVTQSLVKLASSTAASVAGSGDRPTPQVLVENVGAAIAYVAVHAKSPPPIVMQPWGGLTTAGLVRTLGDREPHHVPMALATPFLAAAHVLGKKHAGIAANARRVELLWLGQRQTDGWLNSVGWVAPIGLEGWRQLKIEASIGSSRA